MSHPYLLILSVIVVTGIAGGALNHLMLGTEDSADVGVWQSLLAGVIASFMVPLFLNTISSSLVDSIIGTSASPGDPSKLFILAGFCLVATVFSKAFIRTISAKVLREMKAEVDQVKNEIKPIIEKETEQGEGESTKIKALSVSLADSMHPGEDAKKVLNVLANGKFTLRTRTGISADATMEKTTVNKIVENLKTEAWWLACKF